MGEVIYAPVVCTLYLHVLRYFVNYIHLEIELPRRVQHPIIIACNMSALYTLID